MKNPFCLFILVATSSLMLSACAKKDQNQAASTQAEAPAPKAPAAPAQPEAPKADSAPEAPGANADQTPVEEKAEAQDPAPAEKPKTDQKPVAPATKPATTKPAVSVLAKDLKSVQIKITDKAKAEKVLFRPGMKVAAALTKNGLLVPVRSMPELLKKNQSLCVFVSSNFEFAEKVPVLKSVKITDKTVSNSSASTFHQLQILMTEKDQFFALACEKKSALTKTDIVDALTGIAEVTTTP